MLNYDRNAVPSGGFLELQQNARALLVARLASSWLDQAWIPDRASELGVVLSEEKRQVLLQQLTAAVRENWNPDHQFYVGYHLDARHFYPNKPPGDRMEKIFFDICQGQYPEVDNLRYCISRYPLLCIAEGAVWGEQEMVYSLSGCAAQSREGKDCRLPNQEVFAAAGAKWWTERIFLGRSLVSGATAVEVKDTLEKGFRNGLSAENLIFQTQAPNSTAIQRPVSFGYDYDGRAIGVDKMLAGIPSSHGRLVVGSPACITTMCITPSGEIVTALSRDHLRQQSIAFLPLPLERILALCPDSTIARRVWICANEAADAWCRIIETRIEGTSGAHDPANVFADRAVVEERKRLSVSQEVLQRFRDGIMHRIIHTCARVGWDYHFSFRNDYEPIDELRSAILLMDLAAEPIFDCLPINTSVYLDLREGTVDWSLGYGEPIEEVYRYEQ